MKIILAMSGGSGVGYGLRLLYHAAQQQAQVHIITSPSFFRVLRHEVGLSCSEATFLKTIFEYYGLTESKIKAEFKHLPHGDIGAEAASGSAEYNAMAVVPCSMKTLAAIAHGYTTNLIERSGDVCLKERRKLVLVPRETPYSLIHLENMKHLTLAGAVIMPASPGFYRHPKTIDDLYDFMADRILQHLGFKQRLIDPWQGDI